MWASLAKHQLLLSSGTLTPNPLDNGYPEALPRMMPSGLTHDRTKAVLLLQPALRGRTASVNMAVGASHTLHRILSINASLIRSRLR